MNVYIYPGELYWVHSLFSSNNFPMLATKVDVSAAGMLSPPTLELQRRISHFFHSITWSLKLLSSRPSKEHESHAERLTSGPLGSTVTKGMMLNKDYATDIGDFHTLGCPP